MQLLLPGECAPAHRYSPAAIRFVIQGRGAYTTVEGEKCPMAPGELVLTPSWTWHEHANAGDEAAILFSIQAIPVFDALGLYREEAYAHKGGHQLVTSVFEG